MSDMNFLYEGSEEGLKAETASATGENAVFLWKNFLLILEIWIPVVVAYEEIPHLLVEEILGEFFPDFSKSLCIHIDIEKLGEGAVKSQRLIHCKASVEIRVRIVGAPLSFFRVVQIIVHPVFIYA